MLRALEKVHGPTLFRSFMFLLDLRDNNNHITEKSLYFENLPAIILNELRIMEGSCEMPLLKDFK